MINKILYSCLSRSWGGMEMRTISGIEQLLDRKINTELLCYSGSRIHSEALKRDFTVFTLEVPSYFHPLEIMKTVRFLKRKNYDLIHTQASHDLWLLVPALNLIRSKTPLILTKRVGSFIDKTDFLHRKLYSRVDVTIAISNVIKQNLMSTTSLTENKIKLIHNGVDLTKFNIDNAERTEVRQEFDFDEDDIVIGLVGRFSPGKGHEEFLYAASKLRPRNSHLKFFIVGEPSYGELEYATSIKKMSVDYGLDDCVVFSGYRSDIPDVLSAMDIFTFPSHSEAFGQSLVEAMAMGRPSICSNSDGVLDIAVDGETSLLFESRSAEDFTAKLKKMIDSPDIWMQFGDAAVQRVHDNFDLVKQTDKLIDLYESLMAQQK